jgi:hypothetical protein
MIPAIGDLENLNAAFSLKPSCKAASGNFGEHTTFLTVILVKNKGQLPP